MEIYRNFLIIEHVMHHEQVVYSHEWDRVNEALGIEETLKVIVLFFLLNVAF